MRRRYQKGQLFKRGKNPVWVARWREDVRLSSGETKRTFRSTVLGTLREIPTKRLAQRELDKILLKINDLGAIPKVAVCFDEFAQQWMDTVMPSHKLSSQSAERTIVRKHLVPAFGSMVLGDITAPAIQKFISEQTVNPKTIRNIIGTFKNMWKTARTWGIVNHNPFEGLALPRKVPTEVRVYSVKEMKQIIQKAPEPYKTMYWLLAETGMRIGEARAIRWCDVDFDRGVVQVRQSAWKTKISTPKTATGVRTCHISSELRDHLRLGKYGATDMQFVFSTRNGTPVDYHQVLWHLKDTLHALGLNDGALHAFRHGNATLMISEGVDPKAAAVRLGHADEKVTLRIYSHMVEGADKVISTLVGAKLAPTCTQIGM